jgi:hypothetical protein
MPPAGAFWELCCWWCEWNGMVPGKERRGLHLRASTAVGNGGREWLATTTVAAAWPWLDVDSPSVLAAHARCRTPPPPFSRPLHALKLPFPLQGR